MSECVFCSKHAEEREFLINEFDEHDTLCNHHYVEVLEGLVVATIPDCPSKGKGYRGYRFNPKKIVIVEKVVEQNTSVRRRRRR